MDGDVVILTFNILYDLPECLCLFSRFYIIKRQWGSVHNIQGVPKKIVILVNIASFFSWNTPTFFSCPVDAENGFKLPVSKFRVFSRFERYAALIPNQYEYAREFDLFIIISNFSEDSETFRYAINIFHYFS